MKLNHAHNIHNNRGPTYLTEHFHRKTDTHTIMLVGSKTKLKNVDDFNITCLGHDITMI